MILTAMPSNCQHCGRPISGIPTTIYSRPYHYECTRSPYAQLAKPQPTSHDVADAERLRYLIDNNLALRTVEEERIGYRSTMPNAVRERWFELTGWMVKGKG